MALSNLMQYRFLLLCLAVPAPAHLAAQEEEQPPSVEQRLERMERLLSSQGLMDLLDQMRDLQEEVSQLRGDIEVQNHKIDELTQRQRNLYADIDQRLRRLESGDAAAPASDTGAGTDNPPLTTLSPVTDAGTAGRSSDSALTLEITRDDNRQQQAEAQMEAELENEASGEQQTGSDIQPAAVEQATQVSPVQIRARYQEAFGLLKQSRYDQAIRKFTEFLSAFPDSEYSDNAQYWLAEAYYVTRDFEPALEEYNKLVENYPDSQKLTHGLLKIGYTLHELERPEEARRQLQGLIEKHPGTTAARLADERLNRINTESEDAGTQNTGEEG